jgi:hypothetical protein
VIGKDNFDEAYGAYGKEPDDIVQLDDRDILDCNINGVTKLLPVSHSRLLDFTPLISYGRHDISNKRILNFPAS